MAISLVTLTGHLTLKNLEAELTKVSFAEVGRTSGVIIDALAMTGYDKAAREKLVSWSRQNKSKFRGIAVLTDKLLWRVVVSTMGLHASLRMAPFPALEEAKQWLLSLPTD